MEKIFVFILITFLTLGLNIYAQEAATVSAGQTANVSSQESEIKADPQNAKQLKEYFEPLQINPQYYGDRRFRKKLRVFEVKKLKDYKPNFGKKIWVKSWEYRDIRKKMKLFGQKIRKRKFSISAIEVAEDVAKYLRKELADTDVDVEKWAKNIEEFGRTYVNPDNAGKKKCKIVVADYQNGNYLQVTATKSFRNKRMCYFIGENYDVIIDKLLEYKTRKQRAKEK